MKRFVIAFSSLFLVAACGNDKASHEGFSVGLAAVKALVAGKSGPAEYRER